MNLKKKNSRLSKRDNGHANVKNTADYPAIQNAMTDDTVRKQTSILAKWNVVPFNVCKTFFKLAIAIVERSTIVNR